MRKTVPAEIVEIPDVDDDLDVRPAPGVLTDKCKEQVASGVRHIIEAVNQYVRPPSIPASA